MKTIYVIADTNNNDLVFRLIGEEKISNLYTLSNKAHVINFNPYLVYGYAIEEFIGIRKYDCTIVVSQVTSGRLVNDGP